MKITVSSLQRPALLAQKACPVLLTRCLPFYQSSELGYGVYLAAES